MDTKIVIVAMLLAAPTAAAEIAGRGWYEPDTIHDSTDGFLYLDPDTNVSGRRVYFSAHIAEGYVYANPNVALAKSHIGTAPTNWQAYLGVWKDCNRDGYIGLRESALDEYSSVLLPADTPCIPDRTAPNSPGFKAPHNDGTWVREFIWIGPNHLPTNSCHPQDWQLGKCAFRKENNTNAYDIGDESARVWGDWGRPTDQSKATCPVTPIPRGTTQSTGGLVRYVDCITSWRIVNTTTLAAQRFQALTGSGALHQFTFSDAESYDRPDTSKHVVNQKNPYGHPNDGRQPMANVFDCNKAPIASQKVGDNTYHVRPVNTAPSPNPTGSPARTVNFTEDQLLDCEYEDSPDPNKCCETNGDVYDQLEGDFERKGTFRTQTDFEFWYYEGGNTFSCPHPQESSSDGDPNDTCVVVNQREIYYTVDSQNKNKVADNPVPASTPSDGGIGLAPATTSNNYWWGRVQYLASRNPIVNIDTFQPQGPQWATFYAYVDTGAIQATTPKAGGFYGGEACGTDFTGSGEGSTNSDPTAPRVIEPGPRHVYYHNVKNGWQCNPDDWWVQAADAAGRNWLGNAKTQWQVAVGQPFVVRDIDCLDMTLLAGTGRVVDNHKGVSVTRDVQGAGGCDR